MGSSQRRHGCLCLVKRGGLSGMVWFMAQRHTQRRRNGKKSCYKDAKRISSKQMQEALWKVENYQEPSDSDYIVSSLSSLVSLFIYLLISRSTESFSSSSNCICQPQFPIARRKRGWLAQLGSRACSGPVGWGLLAGSSGSTMDFWQARLFKSPSKEGGSGGAVTTWGPSATGFWH